MENEFYKITISTVYFEVWITLANNDEITGKNDKIYTEKC